MKKKGNNSADISVLIVTYNHEKFIAQAIESVLKQDLSLIKEVIIGDDCSTDSTVDILRQYQAKHPDLIKIVDRKNNVGVNANYVDLFNRCNGEYVAILEGDDYWLEGKLSEMREQIELHPDACMWFHRFQVLEGEILSEREYLYDESRYIDEIEFIKYNQVQNLSCCLYRTDALRRVADRFLKGPGVDYLLHILLLENANAYFYNKNLSVYRHHQNSIWSRLSKEHQQVRSLLRRYEMNELTNYVYNDAFQEAITSQLGCLWRLRFGEETVKKHLCYNILGFKIKIRNKK